MRGLDRIECLIEHYNRPDETVGTTAAQVARRLATLLPLITPTLFNIIVIGEYVRTCRSCDILCLSCDYRPSTEPAQVAFTSPESIAVEGDDDVTICLSVISGEVTTPTNITLIAGSFVATALGELLTVGIDLLYTTSHSLLYIPLLCGYYVQHA